jgi:hypothetical protein
MKYSDLIQFEPVVDIIQLRQADQRARAEQLVSTYVISDRMMDVILHRILPSLRFDQERPGDGLFIVGNYGTGKSHLMALVTAIAEHADLVSKVTHPIVAEGLAPFAGKFKVVRQETGATSKNLRDIVLEDLEKRLLEMGVNYHFPPMDKAANNKDLLIEMMTSFRQIYPDHGLLVAMDELLDYLRGRKDQELALDLNFLRELGEACELTPFRFITGIQESLFDSPRFQFAADSIRRVKARFEQVRIVREDMAYVVSRRLLAKTEHQKQLVRKHLEKFTSLYEAMAEHLDDYVDMFPIHPTYIEVFEQVTVVEKRDLLKALSRQMESKLQLTVPTEEAGFLSFDEYWGILNDDPSYRSVPEIKEVQDKARVLQDRVKNAPGLRDYRPAALRVIAALAVHRLTLTDLYAPVGLTPAELRDQLCLYLPIPERDADFLLTSVESVLCEISRAVNGQFISHNRENDQYYLDLKKDIDFDALIDQRAALLETDQLDRYFFDLLSHSLELKESTYVPGFRIWYRELPWSGRGMTRRGYVFLGAPNERSTAQPERDFYLHFLAPFTQAQPKLDDKPDEVYFWLSSIDADFKGYLLRYAGSKEMSSISSGSNKEQYERKADQLRLAMNNWLRENLTGVVSMRYRGKEMRIPEALTQYRLSIRDLSLRDQIFRLASACLCTHFQEEYEDYPTFSGMEFTFETLPQVVEAALRAIVGNSATRPAQTVLEGLGLAHMENGKPVYSTDDSRYAQHILDRLYALPEGKVLNRSDLITGASSVEKDARFGLEPEWFAVVLLALVKQNEIMLHVPGLGIDSSNLDEALRLGLNGLLRFTAVGRPKPIPEQSLRVLFSGLGLNEDLLGDPRSHGLAASQLIYAVEQEINRVVILEDSLRVGPRYWREPLMSGVELQALRNELKEYKGFLSRIQPLNTPGKLRNFTFGQGEIRHALRTRQSVQDTNRLLELLNSLSTSMDYIYQAEITLGAQDSWLSSAEQVRQEQLAWLRDPKQRSQAGLQARLKGGLANLQDAYIQHYLELHKRARLDSTQDLDKKRLTIDPHWTQLRALSALDFLNRSELLKLEERLGALRSCPSVNANDLRSRPFCPSCGFTPRTDQVEASAGEQLETIGLDFNHLYQKWVNGLRENLKSESSQANLAMISERERQEISQFIQSGQLPDKVTDRLITALRDTLQGLEKITIEGADLLLALTRPGMPCPADEFEQRFRNFVKKHIEGKDLNKIRIQMDW